MIDLKVKNSDNSNSQGSQSVTKAIFSPEGRDIHGTIWKQYTAALLGLCLLFTLGLLFALFHLILTTSVISFGTGCVGGWSSPSTPLLLSGSSDLGIRPLTVDEASWVGSLINLGAFMGSIPAGYLSFLLGRKVCMLFLAWPIIIGWLLIIFNQNNVWFLYVGRFISGISYGSMNIVLPIYNNEICCDKIRGRVGTVYDLFQCFGLLYVYWFGATSSLMWTTVYSLLIPIIFLVTFIWMPESPLYLMRKGKKNAAIRSIRWLYGEDVDLDYQLERINLALLEGTKKQNDSTNEDSQGTSLSPISYITKFISSLNKITIKATLLAFFLFIVQRSCGATMVQYYADNIFEYSHSSIPPNYATVIIGVISVVGSMVSIIAVDTLGRRFLLTFSFCIMALVMAIFTLYVQLIVVEKNKILSSLSIEPYYGLIPAITISIFMAMFRLGVSPVPWFMAPEIIPTEAQKWAPSAIVCITWGSSFVLSKCFLPAIHLFGQVPVYMFFLTVCVIGFLYTNYFIPETKNKSREQIQRALGATLTYDEL